MIFEVKVEKKITIGFMNKLFDGDHYWVTIDVVDETLEQTCQTIAHGYLSVRKGKNVDKRVQRWIDSWKKQYEKKRTYVVKHDD